MRILALGLIVAALATAAIAKPIPPDAALMFTMGVSTPADVIAKLGRPMAVMKNSDGTEILTYVSSSGHVKAATLVPVVGLFAGGAASHASSLVFTFDADGHLKSTSSSDTNVDCSSAVIGANCQSK